MARGRRRKNRARGSSFTSEWAILITMRRFALVIGLLAMSAACGLDAIGSLIEGAADGTRDAATEGTPPVTSDDAAVPPDDAAPDAPIDVGPDVPPLPTDAGAPAVYPVSGRAWVFHPDTN